MNNAIGQNNKVGFFRLFTPLDKKESLIFGGFLAFYLCISLYFAFFSSLIDNTTKETDLYFSLDNPLIFKYGRSHISGHPLTIIFYYPFVVLGNFLASIIGLKAKTVLFAALSSVMVSLSCLYVNRYARKIVELSDKMALLISIFFALFSTNLILCFTPETFTLSLFFLAFCAYYFASYIKEKQPIPLNTSILLSCICLGGVTVTNFVKGFLPILFSNEKKANIAKKILIIFFSFLGLLVLTQITLYLADGRNFYLLMVEHQQVFTSRGDESFFAYWTHVFGNFWGAPMFFSELTDLTYYSPAAQQNISMLNATGFRFWWQYLYVSLLSGTLIWAIIKNYKNKLVQILVLLLAVDLGIHGVLKFGINTPFIYGGHWVYLVPLILAWFFKRIENKRMRIAYILLISFIALLAINNCLRLVEFAQLANQMYPISK